MIQVGLNPKSSVLFREHTGGGGHMRTETETGVIWL